MDEVTDISDIGETEKKEQSVVYEESDWSLGDVLRHTPENTNKKLKVYTPSSKVMGGVMLIDLASDGGKIAFSSADDNLVDEDEADRIEFDHQTQITEDGQVDTYSNKFVEAKISHRPFSDNKKVEITFDNKNFAYYDIPFLGLGDIMKNNDLPKETSLEYAKELIEKRTLKIGRRSIPVEFASDRRILREIAGETPGGFIDVYHGTGLKNALVIAKIGLFAAGGAVTDTPILSAQPDNMSATLAKDEWSGKDRSDPSGYGAIVMFRASPGDVVVSVDIGPWDEKLYHPSQIMTDENERYRLQSGSGVRLPVHNPRYLPPDRIEKIILVKQTPRKR